MGRMKKKKGKAVTRTKQSQQAQQEDEYAKTPHSFIIHRGDVGRGVRQLVRDMRNVMSPFTATNLKPRRKNSLKDYIAIAGPLNVTHLMTFSRSELSLNLRVMRLPKGPTLTFNILEYSLCRDVISSLKRHNMDPKQFQHHPLLVMNGVVGEGRQFPLMATMFQNMFLPINVSQVKLASIKRCVLMNYDKEEDTIEFRHYNIRSVPMGVSRGVKKLLKAKIPNMAQYDDISEFVTRGGNLSESEGELDGEHNQVTLPQALPGRGNMKNAQSAIRLTEIGPRLKLRLVKIETEISSGDVLYHKFIERTKEELAVAEKKRQERKKLKESRKRQQQLNVEKKKEAKETMKKKSLAGMKKKEEDSDKEEEDSDKEEEEDDDVEYYKEEVGVEPEDELLLKQGKKRRLGGGDAKRPFKKPKFGADHEDSSMGKSRGARGGMISRGSRVESGSRRGGGSADFRGRPSSRGRSDARGGRGGSRDGFSSRGGSRGSRGGSRDGFSSRGGSRGSRGGSRGGFSSRGGSRGGRGGSRGGFSSRGGSRGSRSGSRGGFSNRLSFDGNKGFRGRSRGSTRGGRGRGTRGGKSR